MSKHTPRLPIVKIAPQTGTKTSGLSSIARASHPGAQTPGSAGIGCVAEPGAQAARHATSPPALTKNLIAKPVVANPGAQASCLLLLLALLLSINPSYAQFRSSYATQGAAGQGQGQGQGQGGQPQVTAALRWGGALVYPQFRSSFGTIHWIKEQMPLKVYVSHGQTIDSIIDEQLGAPVANVNNLNNWPDLVASILGNPEQLQTLPVAQGFTPDQYQAAVQGINSWKAFEKEGILSFVITEDPGEADIFVFWVHHFVDKMGLGLFAGDIRGYTAKRSFPYKAILAGGKADFKPVVILLRTTESNGVSMPFAKMKASATHEFGHALGIEGHSTYPTDLMSIYYGRGVISPNDAATIRYLYRMTPDLIP